MTFTSLVSGRMRSAKWANSYGGGKSWGGKSRRLGGKKTFPTASALTGRILPRTERGSEDSPLGNLVRTERGSGIECISVYEESYIERRAEN